MLSPVQPACLPSSFSSFLLFSLKAMLPLKCLELYKEWKGFHNEGCMDAVTPNKRLLFPAVMAVGAVWALFLSVPLRMLISQTLTRT